MINESKKDIKFVRIVKRESTRSKALYGMWKQILDCN